VREQNVVFFHTSVSASASSAPGFKKFDFSVPLLIHTTVLPPNPSGLVETYIPSNTKVYINFLTPSATSNTLPHRFASDCLLSPEFTAITSTKSLKPQTPAIREQRLVLNTNDTQTNQMLLMITIMIGMSLILAAVVKRS